MKYPLLYTLSRCGGFGTHRFGQGIGNALNALVLEKRESATIGLSVRCVEVKVRY